MSFLLLALLACSPDADTGRDPRRPRDTGSPPEDSPPVTAWDGCVPGDPEAVPLAGTLPSAPLQGGVPASGEVVFANCGAETWVATPADAVEGHKVGHDLPREWAVWEVTRVALPADVPPGHRVRIPITVVPPETTGDYPYQWSLLDEWVRWIEDPSPVRLLEVQGARTFDLHGRDAWVLPEEPVDGPAMDLLALQYIVIHYNGDTEDFDGDDDVYTDDDFARRLQDSQHYYLGSRGYSYGYNTVVAPDGDAWEVRGTTFQSAANGCEEVNVPGYAIQVPTSTPDTPPTDAQILGVRQAVARIRAEVVRAGSREHLELVGHCDVRPLCDGSGTSCPGDALYAALLAGELEP